MGLPNATTGEPTWIPSCHCLQPQSPLLLFRGREHVLFSWLAVCFYQLGRQLANLLTHKDALGFCFRCPGSNERGLLYSGAHGLLPSSGFLLSIPHSLRMELGVFPFVKKMNECKLSGAVKHWMLCLEIYWDGMRRCALWKCLPALHSSENFRRACAEPVPRVEVGSAEWATPNKELGQGLLTQPGLSPCCQTVLQWAVRTLEDRSHWPRA